MKSKITFLCLFSILFHLNLNSQLPSSFTWKDAHGKNWITSDNKDQKFQGPCNTFASCALTEARFNLEFNKNFAKDISEWHIYSYPCWNHYPIAIEDALTVLQNNGAVNESCQPFPTVNSPACDPLPFDPTSSNYTCEMPCQNPIEKLQISGYTAANFSSNDIIKQTLLCHGPIALNFNNVNEMHQGATHAYLLIGWENITSTKVKWQFKDSWPGPSSGCESNPQISSRTYYKEVNLPGITNSGNLHGYYIAKSQSVSRYTRSGNSWLAANPSISGADFDLDNDGYYFWGFGPKPASVPTGALIDFDDSNSSSGYLDGNCNVAGATIECPPQGNLAIHSVGNYNYLCPNNYYTFYVTGVPSYSSISWSRTPTYMSHFTSSTTSAYVTLNTHSNFGYVTLTATINPNISGCPSYSISRTYYHGSCHGGGGWRNLNSEDVRIYPNPLVGNNINIELSDEIHSIDQILIRNSAGKVIYDQSKIDKSRVVISPESLSSGIYYISIKTEQGVRLEKLVVL